MSFSGFHHSEKSRKKMSEHHADFSGENNPNFGRNPSTGTRKKISEANRGEKNGMWKGNDVGYCALHEYIKNRLPKPKHCTQCGSKRFVELTNISGKYLRKLSDWQWLCRSCHMKNDGRLEILHKKTLERNECPECTSTKIARTCQTFKKDEEPVWIGWYCYDCGHWWEDFSDLLAGKRRGTVRMNGKQE